MNAEHPTQPATSEPTPSTHPSDPTSTSLGQGATGPLTSKPIAADATTSSSEHDGEQMAAPGEGEIARAQQHKTGFGEQADLSSNLEEKKAEQEEMRREVRAETEAGGEGEGDWGSRADVHVEEAVGGRGVPVVVAVEE